MTRLSAIVVMPPDELHEKPWKRLVEIHAGATYEAKRSPEARAKAAPVVIPTLDEMRVVWPIRIAPPKRAKGLPGGSAWWRLEMEALTMKRKKRTTPTAAERRRKNRRARLAAKKAAYLEAIAERDALAQRWSP